jgi:hypothetical protein
MGRRAYPQNGTFHWLSPTSRLTKVYFTTRNTCRARKPPARGVFLPSFLDTDPCRTQKDVPYSAPFLHLHPYIPDACRRTLYAIVANSGVFLRSAPFMPTTRRARKDTSVGVFSPFIHHIEHEITSTGPFLHHADHENTPFDGFSCPAPSLHLNVWREAFTLSVILFSITASSSNIHSLYLYFIEYTFIVSLESLNDSLPRSYLLSVTRIF